MMTSSNGNIFRVAGHLRGIHRSTLKSPHKGQWRVALMFSYICTRINGWVNNGDAGDLRRDRAHYDVSVMFHWWSTIWGFQRYECNVVSHRLGATIKWSLHSSYVLQLFWNCRRHSTWHPIKLQSDIDISTKMSLLLSFVISWWVNTQYIRFLIGLCMYSRMSYNLIAVL